MSWIADLIKHITTSNRLMAAIFIASIVVVVGPSYISQLKPVPGDWQWIPVSVGIFSFIMLMISFLSMLRDKAEKISKSLTSKPLPESPQGLEFQLLKHLGENYGEEPMDLDDLDYSKIKRLDVLAARDALAKKGFVATNEWNKTIIYITPEGRLFLTKRTGHGRLG